MTFDIIRAEKSACSFAGTAEEQTKFDVVDDRHAQGAVSAGRAISGSADEIECARAEMRFRPIAVDACDPTEGTEEEVQVPGAGAGGFGSNSWREGDVMRRVLVRDLPRAGNDIRFQPAVGIREEEPFARGDFRAEVTRMTFAQPSVGQFVDTFRANARIFAGESLDDGAGAVGGSIVDHDQFERDIDLAEQMANGFLDALRLVARGQHDRTMWRRK